jgi:DNA invertase Pin-like site-specific DNA recombinase
MRFAYKRVSTSDQNLDRQLAGLEFDREYTDIMSGKSKDNRPELNALLQNLRKGDEIHVHELSRLGRSVKDLLSLVEEIGNAGATVHFHAENMTFGNQSSPTQDLMLNVFSALAQFERSMLLERQREGIEIAKAKGKYKGKQSRFNEEDRAAIRKDIESGMTKVAVGKKWGVTRGYIYTLAC